MAQSLRKFVGRVPFRRALERKTVRIGRNVQQYPIDQKGKRIFSPLQKERLQQSIAKLSKRSVAPRLSTYQNMLSLLRELGKTKARNLTSLDVVSALAFENGLSAQNLTPKVNAMLSLSRALTKEGKPPFHGNIANYLKSVKSGSLASAYDILSKSKEKLTVEDISRLSKNIPSNVSNSMLVLESMGLATRLPQETSGIGGQHYLWVCTEKRFTPQTLPKTNVAFQVLQKLYKSPSSIKDLAIPQEFFSKKVGSVNGITFSHTLQGNMNTLIRANLVKFTPNKHRIGGVFSLTPQGEKVLVEQQEMDFLHPLLRKALVGKPLRLTAKTSLEKLTPSEQRKLNLIRRFIEIRLNYRASPRKQRVKRGTIKRLAQEYNLSLQTIDRVASMKVNPWSNISTKMLIKKFLPSLHEQNPAAAEWLAQYIEETTGVEVPDYVNNRKRPFSEQKVDFLQRHQIPEAYFNKMVQVYKQEFGSKISPNPDLVAASLVKQVNLPFIKVYAFANWVSLNNFSILRKRSPL
ncbi:MAG: hypothetical protein WCW13_06760 [archaeon]|jgi:predicted transcriptional regulator